MTVRLDLVGHRIEALSVGGIETCFQVPAYDLCFDIGRCPPGADNRSVLLLTHGHIDHAAGLPYYVSLRALKNLSEPRVYCPAPSLAGVNAVLEAWTQLDADTSKCSVTGVSAGDQIELKHRAYARVFRSPHRVATVGYTIFSRVRKLRTDLRGLTPTEISDKARAGEVVDRAVERPEICFPGDTRIEIVESEPTVTQARLLLLECTFVGSDVSIAKAKKAGHIHLDQICERADLFENEAILLTHFSRRHHHNEIRAEVAKMPARLRDRVQLLLHD